MPVAERPNDLIAAVQPDAVLLSDDDGNQATLDLPDDEHYVSNAPYLDQTHDCHFHSLTTCLGELRNENIDITVTHASDDTVILDESGRASGRERGQIWTAGLALAFKVQT